MTHKDRTLKQGMYQPAMNTDTATAEALNALRTATTKRETNAALRRISVLFFVAIREKNAACRDALHEKLANYNFDPSPYAAR